MYDGDKQKVSRAYGPIATPHVFIFYKQRKLRYVGRIDDSERLARLKSRDARNVIDALLKGKKVSVETTRPGGEIIYRKLGLIEPLELKKAIVGYLGRHYK